MAALLEIRGLSVSYRRVPALRDLDVDVAEGEIVSVIGPNGAGKSTMLKALFGLVKPAAGSVRFDGRALTGLPPEEIVRAGLALVPEGRHIFQSLTVAENLALGRANGRPPDAARLHALLDRFPVLRRYYDAPAAGLSGGEQQQLAIARALVSRPRLLLLDEPSLGLAPIVVRDVLAALAELRDEGLTVLLVEQNATQAIALADRTYVLRSGSLAAAGTRAEMQARDDLSEMYLGGPAAAR
jgi:branched-chain amino acid transport system ATP-binding protein